MTTAMAAALALLALGTGTLAATITTAALHKHRARKAAHKRDLSDLRAANWQLTRDIHRLHLRIADIEDHIGRQADTLATVRTTLNLVPRPTRAIEATTTPLPLKARIGKGDPALNWDHHRPILVATGSREVGCLEPPGDAA